MNREEVKKYFLKCVGLILESLSLSLGLYMYASLYKLLCSL